MTNLVTNAAPTGAGEETHVHVLVTNGELIPTLGKLLLFGASHSRLQAPPSYMSGL